MQRLHVCGVNGVSVCYCGRRRACVSKNSHAAITPGTAICSYFGPWVGRVSAVKGREGRGFFQGFSPSLFFGILSGAVPQLCDGYSAGNHYGHSSLTPRSVTDWSGTACKRATPGILAARSSGDHHPEEQWTCAGRAASPSPFRIFEAADYRHNFLRRRDLGARCPAAASGP